MRRRKARPGIAPTLQIPRVARIVQDHPELEGLPLLGLELLAALKESA